MGWTETHVQTSEQLWAAIDSLRQRYGALIWRGQSARHSRLLTSLARDACSGRQVAQVETDELRSIRAFLQRSGRKLGEIEQRFLACYARGDWIAAATVARHYGVRTRLLDWSRCPYVAAFFGASPSNDSRDDVCIWWIDEASFHRAIARQWDDWWYRLPNGQIDLNRARLCDCPVFIAMTHMEVHFDRSSRQRGLFTIGNPIDSSHDELIDKQAPEIPRGRIYLPACLRERVMTQLAGRNIDAVTLGLASEEYPDLAA